MLEFGTDGVRGIANVELTAEFTTSLARAAARVFARREPGFRSILVGRDPRISGQMIVAALSAGFCAESVDVIDLGVIPTPGVAHASVEQGIAGAMVSASHNPFSDNGIKFFLPGGRKLDDATEGEIEAELAALRQSQIGQLEPAGPLRTLASGAALGRIHLDLAAAQSYALAIESTIDGRRLDGLRVVLDCANGAASTVAPEVFLSLGAEVEVINAHPDGVNINADCGSTHPAGLQEAVKQFGAQVGFAFDGDADRMLAVDAEGALVDGDQLMAMMAVDMKSRAVLKNNTVVVTVMTNLGFKLAMEREGVDVVETKVGDRYVLEALEDSGHSLGGEQSGHLILKDFATTGDGTLAAVAIADLIQRTQTPLAELASVMERLPQVLQNIKGVDRSRLDSAASLWEDVRAVEAEFAGRGRVLIRPSGTEALVRVMVEAPTAAQAQVACDRLCESVKTHLS